MWRWVTSTKMGCPEVASIHKPTHTLSVWHYDANEPNSVAVLRTGIDINGTVSEHVPIGQFGSHHWRRSAHHR